MTLPYDKLYYAQREHECREQALRAQDPSVRAVHMEFARRYAAAFEALPAAPMIIPD